MRRHPRPLAAVSVLAALATLPAMAQEQAPDLVGKWSGEAHAVHLGLNPYRPTEGTGANFPDEGIVFTFDITEQHGNRFAGTSTGGPRQETLIGALRPDNSGGIILDDDGRYDFTLSSPDTMDVCYAHAYPNGRVLACYTLTRAP